MDPFKKINIIEYRDGTFSETTDSVASEKLLRIFSNNREILSLLCTPTMVKELVVGFGLSEGLLKAEGEQLLGWCSERIEIFWRDEDIEVNLPIDIPETTATLTSGCAKGVTFISNEKLTEVSSDLKIHIDMIFELFRNFQRKSELFMATGGVHSAALCDKNGIIVFAEDIGRHNAADKIIGYAFLENISMNDKILLLSGRLSSEIAQKAIKACIPILVSRAAPTDRAIEIARKHSLTMIGFLRGHRLNIYSQPGRIQVKNLMQDS
ncbi:MAG: formate dehydrogenase accessory sulfurtransferase FdhD [Nitrospirae bacterium]|nr:formate dehydrogenase accessory sulfurtransferase FdhD [Nitrospirota bacterium]